MLTCSQFFPLTSLSLVLFALVVTYLFLTPLEGGRKDPWRSPRLRKDKESASPGGAAANPRPRYPSIQGSASGKGHHHHAENGGETRPRGIGIGERRNSRRRLGRALSFLQRAHCPFSLLWSCQEQQIRDVANPDSRLRWMHNGSLRKPFRSVRQQGKGSLLPVGMSRR